MADHTTEAELRFLLTAARHAKDFVQAIDRMLGAVIVGLEELERMRNTIKRDRQPLDWQSFLAEFERDDAGFVHALRQATCNGFSLGRLEIEAGDSTILTYLKLCKTRLETALSDRYGAKFRVKIV